MKTGAENDIPWSEKGSGFGKPGCTSPPRIPRSTPTGEKLGSSGRGEPPSPSNPELDSFRYPFCTRDYFS